MNINLSSFSMSIFLLYIVSACLLGANSQELDCSAFSVGKCDSPPESILAVQSIPGNLDFEVAVDICQKICFSIAGCNYISYDHVKSECLIMNHDIHNGYLSSCDIISGPDSPTLVDCDRLATDSCQLFVRENCEYTGAVLYSSKDVLSAVECQVLMQGIGVAFGADIWVHDSTADNLCEFRRTREAECSGVNGPPQPSYLECAKSQTTSEPSTTSTTSSPTTTTTPPTTTTSMSAPTTTTQYVSTSPASTTFSYEEIVLEFTSLNAIDNSKLPGVTVDVNVNGNDYIFVTDEQGFFSQTIPETVYQGMLIEFNCTKEEFLAASNQFRIVDASSDTVQVTQSLTPNLNPNQTYRVVMNWGTNPQDLDLHVTEFSSNYTCDTYYGNKTGCEGLSLDVDNTNGGNAGAETITWNQYLDSLSFLIYVVDYSREPDYPLAKSQVSQN